MKGKVFIGWCGDTNIADEVKAKLKANDYEGVIGGESGSTTTLYLGQAILNEINACNQAIFVFQKKKDGFISPNTLYEFGYALSRFPLNKVFAFYIDFDHNDKSIPSDLSGIWAEHLETKNGKVPDGIIEFFLNHQKNVVQENKMELINSYFEMRHDFTIYDRRPFCSEYELAQYVLFFSQAAYLMNDVKEGSKCLERLASAAPNRIDELEQALRFGQGYLSIFKMLKTKEGVMFLEAEPFGEIERTFNDILDTVSEWSENDFTTWFEMLLYDSLNYIHVLCAADPGIPEEERNDILLASRPYAENCLARCDVLADNNDDAQCARLYRAYMYRNLATSFQKCSEPDEKESVSYLRSSLKERKSLLEHYKIRSISSTIFEAFEMEYYIAVSELIEYSADEREVKGSIRSCGTYLKKIKQLHQQKQHYYQNKKHQNFFWV